MTLDERGRPMQEIMTGEQAKALNAYRDSLDKWRGNQREHGRTICFLLVWSLLLWALSWLASGLDGIVNRSAWYTFFTMVSFVGACITSVAFVITMITRNYLHRPTRPHSTIELDD